MAQVIHAKRGKDGTTVYRVWSTVTDSYLTDELSETALRAWLRRMAVARALEEVKRDADDRIARARETGTSSRVLRREAGLDRWEKERT